LFSLDTYTIKLPDNLPPTFKGKSLRFSYELVVGICRAGCASGGSANSISRVMKVPIRMYNHVVGGFLIILHKSRLSTNV
jgi:hypothetical protein